MDRGGAREALDGAVQRGDAPVRDRLGVDIERGLIELDDVDAVGGQTARFLVEQLGERHRHLDAVAIMASAIVSAMVIGPGRVNLSRRCVWARATRASRACTRPFSRNAPVTVGTIAL